MDFAYSTTRQAKAANGRRSRAADDAAVRRSDRAILTSVVILMIFGALAVYSSIYYFAESNQASPSNLIISHIVKLVVTFIVLLIASKIDYHIMVRFSRIALICSWIAMIAVMLYGREVYGAQRSLSLGILSFQPASLASIALLTHVSVLLSEKQNYIKNFGRAFLPVIFWVLTTCALIGIEDFSSAAILLFLCLLLMFVGGIRVLHLSGLFVIGLLGATLLVMQSQERQNRIYNHIEQAMNIKANNFSLYEGYQTQQAQIAIARGQLFGAGIGKSTQRAFLPAPYNDFIFAIITEEYGLLGALGLIFLYTLIFLRGLGHVARRAPDLIGSLMAISATLIFVIYGYVNAGVATGLLPVTGLPMPLISYGGSNLVFMGLMIGILLNISKQTRPRKN